MGVNLFRFPNKKWRSQVIKEYMEERKIEKAVCFSCGNASRELKLAGVNCIDVSTEGDLIANRWFTVNEIKDCFSGCFDATSGHLPIDLMIQIARYYKAKLISLPKEIYLPCGSGETLVCLKMAFPKTKINAVYNLDPATEYSEKAPLNSLVVALAEKVYLEGKWQVQE